MAIDYGKTARELVKELGENNIINVRLRFSIDDLLSLKQSTEIEDVCCVDVFRKKFLLPKNYIIMKFYFCLFVKLLF